MTTNTTRLILFIAALLIGCSSTSATPIVNNEPTPTPTKEAPYIETDQVRLFERSVTVFSYLEIACKGEERCVEVSAECAKDLNPKIKGAFAELRKCAKDAKGVKP